MGAAKGRFFRLVTVDWGENKILGAPKYFASFQCFGTPSELEDDEFLRAQISKLFDKGSVENGERCWHSVSHQRWEFFWHSMTPVKHLGSRKNPGRAVLSSTGTHHPRHWKR